MHNRRKKQRRFNTVIIKKSEVLVALICGFLIITICFGITLNNDFSVDWQYAVIKDEISFIDDSSERINIYLKKAISRLINPEAVLAQTLPMLEDIEETNERIITKSESSPNIENTQPAPLEEMVPKNTFPIIDTRITSSNLEIRNETTYQPDIESLLYAPLSFNSPEILIVHTHASESYKKDNFNYYSEDELDRTTDINHNVVRVGEELAKELVNNGFKVTHAKDINDYPSYNQSYNKTLEVINTHLRENKNIQIVIDLHRDSIVKNDGAKMKFTSEINGEKVAQVMIVCGTNQAGLANDTWQENLKFALKMQNYMEVNFPGFARPLNLRQERFNTHATLGSMIIEVGTSGNTLEEALSATKYLAKTVKEVLKPYG